MQKTQDAETLVDDIINKLPEDRQKIGQLANDVTRTRNDMNYAQGQSKII